MKKDKRKDRERKPKTPKTDKENLPSSQNIEKQDSNSKQKMIWKAKGAAATEETQVEPPNEFSESQ